MSSGIQLTNAAFLMTVFFPLLCSERADGGEVWINHFSRGKESWQGHVLSGPIEFGAQSTYFCISTMKPDHDGRMARKKENFAGLYCVVLDDVGTKVDETRITLPPTWKFETSPGNFQVGYVLSEPLFDPDEADQLMAAAIEAGLTDKGAGGPRARYMRLPVGLNFKEGVVSANGGKPFRVVVRHWEPGVAYTPAQLFAGLQLGRGNAPKNGVAVVGAEHVLTALDRTTDWIESILAGANLHDSLLKMAGSLAARGTPEPVICTTLQAVMNASAAPHDDRWQERYDDIPRLVRDGTTKFGEPNLVEDDRGALVPLTIAQLLALPPLQWLVKGVIPKGGLGVLYGESGAGKTFIALDIALAVAQGKEWNGNRVQQSGVIYLAAEGAYGLSRRVQAYQKYHGVNLDPMPFGVVPVAINLMNGPDHQRLAEACQAMAEQGQPVGLIVIDTLNRVMPGGNENAPEDMSAVIGHADAIAKATGAFVLIIHHSGKDVSKGARGHSSLRAAMDTEFEVRVDGDVRILTLTKSREGESGVQFAFRLEKVVLDMDEDLCEIASCVAVAAKISDARSNQPTPQGKWQEAVCLAVKTLVGAASTDGRPVPLTHQQILAWIEKNEETLPDRWKDAARRAITELVKKKLVLLKGDADGA